MFGPLRSLSWDMLTSQSEAWLTATDPENKTCVQFVVQTAWAPTSNRLLPLNLGPARILRVGIEAGFLALNASLA